MSSNSRISNADLEDILWPASDSNSIARVGLNALQPSGPEDPAMIDALDQIRDALMEEVREREGTDFEDREPVYARPSGEELHPPLNRAREDAQDAFASARGIFLLDDVNMLGWLARFRRLGARRDLFTNARWAQLAATAQEDEAPRGARNGAVASGQVRVGPIAHPGGRPLGMTRGPALPSGTQTTQAVANGANGAGHSLDDRNGETEGQLPFDVITLDATYAGIRNAPLPPTPGQRRTAGPRHVPPMLNRTTTVRPGDGDTLALARDLEGMTDDQLEHARQAARAMLLSREERNGSPPRRHPRPAQFMPPGTAGRTNGHDLTPRRRAPSIPESQPPRRGGTLREAEAQIDAHVERSRRRAGERSARGTANGNDAGHAPPPVLRHQPARRQLRPTGQGARDGSSPGPTAQPVALEAPHARLNAVAEEDEAAERADGGVPEPDHRGLAEGAIAPRTEVMRDDNTTVGTQTEANPEDAARNDAGSRPLPATADDDEELEEGEIRDDRGMNLDAASAA